MDALTDWDGAGGALTDGVSRLYCNGCCKYLACPWIIEVATEKKHDMLLITVDNSFDGILFQENGKIYSKKRQNKQEGIGILSMKKLCEKHGGASHFEAVGNRFQASFILKSEVED